MAPTRVFIRHADKGVTTDDDPLLPGQEIKIANRATYLAETFGTPDIILVSPYLRTRQTAELLQNGLSHPVPMHIEPLLGEYIKPDRDHTIRDDTLALQPPLWDSPESMTQRVQEVYRKYVDYPGTIWLVCHGVFIGRLQMLFGKLDIRPPTLSAFIITPDRATFNMS